MEKQSSVFLCDKAQKMEFKNCLLEVIACELKSPHMRSRAGSRNVRTLGPSNSISAFIAPRHNPAFPRVVCVAHAVELALTPGDPLNE